MVASAPRIENVSHYPSRISHDEHSSATYFGTLPVKQDGLRYLLRSFAAYN